MGSLQSEIERTLNSWEAPKTTIGTGSIASKTFNFVKEHPTCTSDDVCNALGIDTGRSSATLLSLYQKGKLDRKAYPNPNPDGKRHEVYTYWTAVDNFTDKGVDRRPKKIKLQKRESTFSGVDIDRKMAKRFEMPRMEQVAIEIAPEPKAFDADVFVANLNVHDAKKIYNLLRKIFG